MTTPSAAPMSDTNVAYQCCLSSVRVDYEEECYVLAFDYNRPSSTLAASLSNRIVKLYTFRETQAQFTGQLAQHAGRISEVAFLLPGDPHLLHTACLDGVVRGWDLRTHTVVEQFTAPKSEVACCDCNGSLMAAGAGDRLLFWERRTGRPLAAFDDSHAQDVTQVKFAPSNKDMLISGSEDGLLSLFDVSAGLDEEESFKAALNIETAVARIGFYASQSDILWCTTGTETLYTWEWAAACREDTERGTGPLSNFSNARQDLQYAATGIGAQELADGVDYLLGCEYDARADTLYVIAGSEGGTLGVYPVHSHCVGRPVGILRGVHRDCVRAFMWLDDCGRVAVTGGEDSLISFWGFGPSSPSSAFDSTSNSEGAVRRQAHPYSKTRHSPY